MVSWQRLSFYEATIGTNGHSIWLVFAGLLVDIVGAEMHFSSHRLTGRLQDLPLASRPSGPPAQRTSPSRHLPTCRPQVCSGRARRPRHSYRRFVSGDQGCPLLNDEAFRTVSALISSQKRIACGQVDPGIRSPGRTPGFADCQALDRVRSFCTWMASRMSSMPTLPMRSGCSRVRLAVTSR